ncbi:MAG: hypothetical protein LUG13_00590 [Oscillospiraceae bacterium]|nr:hypothetical protein [Oscillospiraceae bacterium]
MIDENERLFLDHLSADLLKLKEQVDAQSDGNYTTTMTSAQFSAIAQELLNNWDWGEDPGPLT